MKNSTLKSNTLAMLGLATALLIGTVRKRYIFVKEFMQMFVCSFPEITARWKRQRENFGRGRKMT